MPTVWDGHGGTNGGGPPQRGLRPRGQSSLDVIVEGGFLPPGSGPIDYANWLREPLNAIIGDLNTYIDARFALLWAPFVSDVQDIADAAAASAGLADADRIAAQAARDAALAAQAAAEAAAALVVGGVLAAGFVTGLYMSPNSANPTTRIDVTVGQARSSDNTTDIILAAPMTKRLDAVWVAGTGNGGRDVPTALAADQSWHMHLVWHPTGPVVDIVFSLSVTAPTLPAGYTKSAYIGPLPRLGSESYPASGTAIPFFLQDGNQIQLRAPSVGYQAQSGTTSPQLKDLPSVPLGIKVNAILYAQYVGDGNTGLLVFKDPDLGVPSAFGGNDQWAHIRVSTNERYLTYPVGVKTNTLGRVYVHSSYAPAIWAAKVIGFTFPRGLQ